MYSEPRDVAQNTEEKNVQGGEDIDELVRVAGLHKVDGDVVEPFALWNNWWRNQA